MVMVERETVVVGHLVDTDWDRRRGMGVVADYNTQSDDRERKGTSEGMAHSMSSQDICFYKMASTERIQSESIRKREGQKIRDWDRVGIGTVWMFVTDEVVDGNGCNTKHGRGSSALWVIRSDDISDLDRGR